MTRPRTHLPALAAAALAAPARPAQRPQTRDVQEPRSDLTIDTPGAAA